MADSVKEFMHQMHEKSWEDYINSRSWASMVVDWLGLGPKMNPCYVDLSETLFDRLKKEEGIETTGTLIDVGGFTVRCSPGVKPDFRVTTPGFSDAYDSKTYGLRQIVEEKK